MTKIKVEKSRIYQYTNALHLQFFVALLSLIRKFGADILKIGGLFDRICACVEQEEDCYKIVRKSDISALKADSDRARDDIVAGIKKLLDGALLHFDVNVKQAAYRLKIVFDTYNQPTPILALPYDAETVSINNLLQEWENNYSSDLEITGLLPWVYELKERNNTFDELTRRYSQQLAEKTTLRPKDARSETDAYFKQIILVINANIITEEIADNKEEESVFAPFVSELNVLIKHYNDLLAQHIGRLEAKKEKDKNSETGNA